MKSRMLWIAGLGLAAGMAAEGQARFEVASVKVSSDTSGAWRGIGGGRGGPGTSSPGQYTAVGVSLKNLLFGDAFFLSEYQYSAPPWMEKSLYDLAAKVPAGATRDQFRVMLQNLLIERFRIELHREQRETTIYDLAIARGGLKMARSPFDDSVPWAHANLKRDAEGLPFIPEGSGPTSFGTGIGGQFVMVTNRGSIPQLISLLSRNLKVPVEDKTGMSGNFAYRLHFLPPGAQPPSETASDPAPSLHDALQSQLGLKLEPRKGAIDVLVIDKAEKIPIEN